jgi:hypothetical protein
VQLGFVSKAIRPKSTPCCPVASQPFVVRQSVLDDESLNPVRMGQGHSKADGPSVMLRVKRLAREPDRLAEMIDDLGVVIERIREGFWVWPVAVPETWVVRLDEVIPIGKTGEERLEHPRRRGQTVEQQNRRSTLRSRLAIKNGESVSRHCAIKTGSDNRYPHPFLALEVAGGKPD